MNRKGKRLLLIGALLIPGVFALLFGALAGTEEPAFQALTAPPLPKLQWVFITRGGGELSEYDCLLPTPRRLEELAGVPVEATVCTADKFMNLIAADAGLDIATQCYANPKLKRFEMKMEDLQDLLDRELPGFQLPQRFRDWCGNTKGNVYAYPHIPGKGEDPCAGVVMLANRKLMEDCSISGSSFANKDDALRALKAIRKARSDVIPSYMDLITLQQMFGARVQDQDGDWQDVFFQEETLEALKYMNLLYSERLLSQDVFTMTQRYLLSQLREEKVFLAATGPLYSLLQSLPEDDPIWEKYEIVGPTVPDSGKDFRFWRNYGEQYASTIFLADSEYPEVQARLLLWFCCQNMELSKEQRQAAEAAGLAELLNTAPSRSAAPGGVYERYAQPAVPYEVMFAHYADTRLSNTFEAVESCRQTQVVRIVVSTPQSEVEQIYRETLLEMENRGHDLMVQWKQNKYRQAMLLATE